MESEKAPNKLHGQVPRATEPPQQYRGLYWEPQTGKPKNIVGIYEEFTYQDPCVLLYSYCILGVSCSGFPVKSLAKILGASFRKPLQNCSNTSLSNPEPPSFPVKARSISLPQTQEEASNSNDRRSQSHYERRTKLRFAMMEDKKARSNPKLYLERADRT